MSARHDLEVVHTRARRGGEPVDYVEVVDLASGEVVLFWDVRSGDVRAMLRRLRADLGVLDTGEFLARWGEIEV